MEGDERRQFILKLLAGSESPLSGTEIAGKCGVSRQIIVQDIALLRATNKNILSTYRGYLLYQPEKDTENFKRTFAVSHTDEQIQDELYTFVDCGRFYHTSLYHSGKTTQGTYRRQPYAYR